MINIMFVCHGNICRSPMAEYVMRDLVNKSGCEKDINVSSSATSYEEIGNPVHRGTVKILAANGIPFSQRSAVKLKASDYEKFDYIIGMDEANIRNILRISGGDPEQKVFKLLDFCGGGDVADPWYTGDFECTYRDVARGCRSLLSKLI